MTRIAAIQAAPVFMDRSATIDKACDYIARVGREGGQLELPMLAQDGAVGADVEDRADRASHPEADRALR